MIQSVDSQNALRVKTGVLNELLARATRACSRVRQGQAPEGILHHPGLHAAAYLRVLLQLQATVPFSYQRYIENQIREAFGLVGTPVRILIRERGEKI